MNDYERVMPHQPHERVTITLYDGHIEGLLALLHWCQGFSAANSGRLPGAYELTMHLREINAALRRNRLDREQSGQ